MANEALSSIKTTKVMGIEAFFLEAIVIIPVNSPITMYLPL